VSEQTSLSISTSKHKPVSLLSPLFILKKKQLNDINESYSTIPFFWQKMLNLFFYEWNNNFVFCNAEAGAKCPLCQ